MRFIDAPLYARQIILVLLIVTFVTAIIGLVIAVGLCKKRRFIAISSVSFAFSFLSVLFTMRGSYRYGVGLSVFEPSLTILKLPLWSFCVWTAALFGLTVFGLVGAVEWNKKHLSPTSIKESVDSLPAGICFYEPSGLVRLINAEMNRLCVSATGKALLDGVGFWKRISAGEVENGCVPIRTGKEPIIEYGDGKVVAFKKYVRDADGKKVFEIVATDVTEIYRLTKESERKHAELKEINERLVEYGDSVTELIGEKELLAAKIRIHDDMGKLLLATKRKLTEPLTEKDGRELLDFWKAETAALKSVRERKKKNDLQVITDAANLIGVKLEFCGEPPKEDTTNEKILIAAMRESLTNVVSHANGKTMTVTAADKDGKYSITIINDGEKPKGEITEGGGLSGLRALVERENGKMTIESKPRFILTIELPQTV